MVAISLYRGNLHRVPDVPRRWPFPPRTVSLRSFKLLTRKRSLALAHLNANTGATDTKKIKAEVDHEKKDAAGEEGVGENAGEKPVIPHVKEEVNCDEPLKEPSEVKEDKDVVDGVDSVTVGVLETGGGAVDSEVKIGVVLETGGGAVDSEVKIEVRQNENVAGDKEERRKELDRKLKVLNDKKHHLVQMLKQILNAEEEMKRRSMQPPGFRASIPMLVDPTLDMGSATRHASRMSVEVTPGGDFGVECDDSGNPNLHSHHLNAVHSTSPSAASPLGRSISSPFQRNPAHHTQGSLAPAGHGQTLSNTPGNAAASPSRFGPSGHQGHAAGLPPVSVPMSLHVASSSSPAASGGPSSILRDSRLTSPPWY